MFKSLSNQTLHLLINQDPEANFNTELSCAKQEAACKPNVLSLKLYKISLQAETGAVYNLELKGKAKWVSVLLTSQLVSKLYIGQPYSWEPLPDEEEIVLEAFTAYSNVLIEVSECKGTV